MEKYTSLADLARAGEDELRELPQIGPRKAAVVKSAFALASKLSEELGAELPLADSPARVADLLREEVRLLTTETFIVLLLNARRRLTRYVRVAQGTLDSVFVHPRDVFSRAITAHSIIIAHNHPSGDPSPSEADIKVTRDLIRAGQLLKIEVVDHIILGLRTAERSQDYASLRELGYFYT